MWVLDILVLWTLGPWDPWTLKPLDLGTLGPLPSSNTSSYFPLYPLTSSCLFLLLSSFGMVWYGGGHLVLTLEIEIDNWTWSFNLYIDVKKLWGGCASVYNVSSGPFLSYDIWDCDWRWTGTQAWQFFSLVMLGFLQFLFESFPNLHFQPPARLDTIVNQVLDSNPESGNYFMLNSLLLMSHHKSPVKSPVESPAENWRRCSEASKHVFGVFDPQKWNLSINSPSPEGASSCMIVICFFIWNMNFQGSLPLKRPPPHPVCAHKY